MRLKWSDTIPQKLISAEIISWTDAEKISNDRQLCQTYAPPRHPSGWHTKILELRRTIAEARYEADTSTDARKAMRARGLADGIEKAIEVLSNLFTIEMRDE